MGWSTLTQWSQSIFIVKWICENYSANGQKIYIFAQNSTLSLNLVKGPKPGFFQLFLKHLVTQN